MRTDPGTVAYLRTPDGYSEPWANRPWVAISIATTGLEPGGIVEVAMARRQPPNGPHGFASVRCNPGPGLVSEPGALLAHGVPDEGAEERLSPREALAAAWMTANPDGSDPPALILTYSRPFLLKFLRAAGLAAPRTAPLVGMLDVVTNLCNAGVLRIPGGRGLANVASFFGVSVTPGDMSPTLAKACETALVLDRLSQKVLVHTGLRSIVALGQGAAVVKR